jgi:hypothetical protein
MPNFLHIGHFPFCIGEIDPNAENERYNSELNNFGLSGYGKIYPVGGMPLEDAMVLYWKLLSIDFEWNQTITCTCPSPPPLQVIRENYGVGPFLCASEDSGLEQPNFRPTGPTDNDVYAGRACGGGHKMYGTAISYNEFCRNDAGVVPPPVTNSGLCFPMTCFFNPKGPSQMSVDYFRILKHNDLYYPSFLVSIIAYSRLYITQFFINPDPETVVSSYGQITMILNGNTYLIPLLEIYNYTSSCLYDVDIGTITCNTI